MARLMGYAILLPSLSSLVSFIQVSIDIPLSSICLGPQLTILCPGFNIASDVVFATLPIPIIWSLQMKKLTRIYLVGVFSLGYVYGPRMLPPLLHS